MLRIASVPGAHPYVERLGGDVVRLEDPVGESGSWWPPRMVDPAWIRQHVDDFDLMHLHFGLESFPAEHLRRTVAALRAADKPLVYTVHDLENPQLTDQAAHRAALDVLVPAADVVVTLTDGAAREIRERWGRTAHVVAHPEVLATNAPPGTPSEHRVLGLSLRDLRPNLDPVTAARTALAAAERLGIEARVDMHARVRDPVARDAIRALAGPRLRELPRPDDAALARTLADADVQVLPYVHGTHSGWLELCWDLGLAVAVPRVGHFAEQHPDPTFAASYDPGDAGSLRDAVARLLTTAPRPGSPERLALVRARRRARQVQRQAIAEAHGRIYARAMVSLARAG